MWQPQETRNEYDILGEELSRWIECPVRYAPYSNYDKPMFECYCGKPFPIFAVKGAMESGNWDLILQRHNGEI
jgi:hypothetical protein